MKNTGQKSGSSHAVQISKSPVKQADLEFHTDVKITLDELLAGVTRKNIHTPEEVNAPVGNEVW